jgi:hypothetical protein
MQQKLLFKQISRLSKQEFARFREFVSSAFFNKRKDIVRFVIYLEPLFPDFQGTDISDESIYRNVYQTSGLNRQVVKNLLNRTLSLYEKFLIQLRTGAR